MRLTRSHDRLAAYTAGQLRALFPDDHDPLPEINTVLPQALQRLTYCFSHIKLKYYADEHGARFNHLNTDLYAAYLYVRGAVTSPAKRSATAALRIRKA